MSRAVYAIKALRRRTTLTDISELYMAIAQFLDALSFVILAIAPRKTNVGQEQITSAPICREFTQRFIQPTTICQNMFIGVFRALVTYYIVSV